MHTELAKHRIGRSVGLDRRTAAEDSQLAAWNTAVSGEYRAVAFSTLDAVAMTHGFWCRVQLVTDRCTEAASLVDRSHCLDRP